MIMFGTINQSLCEHLRRRREATELGRQSTVSARSKGRDTDFVRRGGTNQVIESGRKHVFSLDSLDKEILQTMSRGSKLGHVSLPSDSASESSGSAQEKTICSRESLHPEVVSRGYSSPDYNKRNPKTVTPNYGVHPSESTQTKGSRKPGDHGARNIGQLPAPTLPKCLETDVRPNGYKQQVSVTVNGGKHQQDSGHWHHPELGALHHSVGSNESHLAHLKNLPFRDAHRVICNQDAEVSSSTSGEDNAEETRRKRVSEDLNSGITGGRSQQRSALKSKPAKPPSSKWDDADKWIASPGHNDSATALSAGSGQGLAPSPLQNGKRPPMTGHVVVKELDSSNVGPPRVESSFSLPNVGIASTVNVKDHIQQIECAIQNSRVKSPPGGDHGKRRGGAKCVDLRPSARSDPAEKRGDSSIITSTMYVQRPKDSRLEEFTSPPTLGAELPEVPHNPVSIPATTTTTENPPLADTSTDALVKDIFSNGPHSRSASDFPRSISVRESGTERAQPSALYRDMGTQMTPNPSVRHPRSDNLGAFNNSPSRHNTPDHSRRTASVGAAPANTDVLDLPNGKTDKLGCRVPNSQPHPTLDRSLNWSTREEEEAESATCLRDQDGGETQICPFETWALAWEEAERAKYTARFHQEEARIKVWEGLQKGKAEARMRKTETKLEKMHEIASHKMSNQIAAVNRKAEEMRAAAEVFRDELASKAKHRAEYIRQTGNPPTTMGCFASRLVPFQSYTQ